MNEKIIMVIDDEEQMRKMIRTFLEKDGYTVVDAANGSNALSYFDKIDIKDKYSFICSCEVKCPSIALSISSTT